MGYQRRNIKNGIMYLSCLETRNQYHNHTKRKWILLPGNAKGNEGVKPSTFSYRPEKTEIKLKMFRNFQGHLGLGFYAVY